MTAIIIVLLPNRKSVWYYVCLHNCTLTAKRLKSVRANAQAYQNISPTGNSNNFWWNSSPVHSRLILKTLSLLVITAGCEGVGSSCRLPDVDCVSPQRVMNLSLSDQDDICTAPHDDPSLPEVGGSSVYNFSYIQVKFMIHLLFMHNKAARPTCLRETAIAWIIYIYSTSTSESSSSLISEAVWGTLVA